MPVSVEDFWKLAAASELLETSECEALRAEFTGLKGAQGQANARSLAQWLVANSRLTRYQAAMLAAGRPGPFVFGPFVVTDRIESGRLAQIFRATHNGTDQVLLVFLAQLTDDADQYQQLAAMAKAAAAVKNPHVSRTYGAARHRSQTFLVVENVAGESLPESLANQKLATQAACQVGFQVALGLVAMHTANLVHGAVCPANVWMGANGAARLLQFPLVPPEEKLKRAQPPLVDYLAPELTEGHKRATALADIYGLGCTLYELIAGRVPFPGGTPAQKLARHRAEFPLRLDELDPQIPEELADLVAEMLAKDPMLRCQTASHVAHLLSPFATGSSRRAGQPPKMDAGGLAPGYGAWKAPDWQSPPQQFRPAPVKSESKPAEVAPQAQAPVESLPPELEPEISVAPEDPHVNEFVAPAIVINVTENPSRPASDSAAELAFVVTDTADSAVIRPPRRRKSNAALWGIGAGLFLLSALVVAAIALRSGEKTSSVAPAARTKSPSVDVDPLPVKEPEPLAPPETAPPEIEGDGKTLWASPTSGTPLATAYLPSGAQLLITLRPAELWSNPEGEKLLDALGPGRAFVESQLREVLGIEPSQIEQLIVAFTPDEALVPQATFVARLGQEPSAEALLAAWGKPASKEHQGKPYFQGKHYAYYRPAASDARLVVIAPSATMQQILELDGRPLLRTGMEKLLASSDAARQVNLLFTPSYLLTDGRGLLTGHLGKLQVPLREFLEESIEAVLVSAHVGEALYVEFRAIAPLDQPAPELLKLLEARWQKIPERVESYVASLQPQPHGRLVINRFPRMLQLARDFTRGGVESGQVVLNAYLPPAAAHNLVMGAELTLLESSGTALAAPAPTAPRAIADVLRKKISLSFPRESLDRAMDVLARELGVAIVILGPDLQAEGITKNQSLNGVDERDQPAGDILRKLLKLANPEGKLVFVIRPNDKQDAIFITTRAATKKRGEALPAGF